jgi:hypothetical protein
MTRSIPISGLQTLIPAGGANSQFNSYLQIKTLDPLSGFIQAACFLAILFTMAWELWKRFRQFKTYNTTFEDGDYKNFALFEDADQKKMLRNGGGNDPIIAIFLFVFSLIVSINIWVSL